MSAKNTTKKTAKKAAKKKATTPKATRTAKSTSTTAKDEATPRKLTALDAAAKVLAQAREPMNARALIEAMESKGLWKSPSGQTPQATLYAAMLREITTKGTASRFVKHDRGTFTVAD